MVGVGHTVLSGEVKMKIIEYGGWKNCVQLSNGDVELIVTTQVGPRVIRYGFVGGQNLFKEYKDQVGKCGGDEWRIYGSAIRGATAGRGSPKARYTMDTV